MKTALSRKNLWAALPRRLKATLGRPLAAIPLPWLLGRAFRRWYHFVAASQWWDAERLRRYQLTKLRKVVGLAYERSRYYRESFKGVGFEPGDLKDLSDLSGLPTIDKHIVRERLNDMLTTPPDSRHVDYMSTSGTGGTPLGFYIDRDRSAVEFAHLSQSWMRVGYVPGATTAVLRGNVVGRDRAGRFRDYDPLLRQYIYSSFHLSPEHMVQYVEHMRTVRPKFLQAYPSSAHTLARFMLSQGLQLPDTVIAILLGSEPVYPHQRQFMAENLRARLYSWYGHTEKLVLAAECEYSTAYHVWPTYGYFELLDSHGREVERGDHGEIVGTGFINRAVPFIRYRTDDFAVRVADRCELCRRNHVLIDRMRAHRSQEFLITRDRRAIVAWTALNMHDDTFDGIMQFQFVQTVPGEAELLVVPTAGEVRYNLDRIDKHLRAKLKGQVVVKVRLADRIEHSPSGKKPLIRQHVTDIDHLVTVFEA